MEKRWNKLKNLSCSAMAAALAGMIPTLILVSDKNLRMNTLAFCLSLLIFGLGEYIHCKHMLGSQAKMKAEHIRLNDERNVTINAKASESAFKLVIYTVSAVALISVFFGDKIFFTMSAICFVLHFISAAFTVYYRKTI